MQDRLEYVGHNLKANRYKQAHRLFYILVKLSRNKTLIARNLARELRVSRKTILRDLQFLEHWVPLYSEVEVDESADERRAITTVRLLDGYTMPKGLIKAAEHAEKTWRSGERSSSL